MLVKFLHFDQNYRLVMVIAKNDSRPKDKLVKKLTVLVKCLHCYEHYDLEMVGVKE